MVRFSGKKFTEYKAFALISLHIFSEVFFIVRIMQGVIIIKVYSASRKVLVFIVRF
jgi:hypothetical protein